MIHYTCDECGQDVYEAEAIGPGVFQFFDGHPAMGKAYEFEDDKSDLTLTIHFGSRNQNHQHFCLACLWKTVHAMVLKYSPLTGITINETAGWPSGPFIAKVNSTPTSEPQLAVVEEEKEDEDGDRRVMLCKNIDEVKEVLAEIEAEKDRDVEVEVPNAEVPFGTKSADTQLSAMHAEGVLPETGPNVGPDDQGTNTPTGIDRRIPNFDDDAHPGRIDYTRWPIHRVRNGPWQSRGRS